MGQGKYQATESDSRYGDTFHDPFLQYIRVTEIQLSTEFDHISKDNQHLYILLYFNTQL